MSDVFISYKSEERMIAAALADYLEARGYTVWWDAALLAGAQFQKVLLNQIKITKAVVVIWSRRSVESDFVLDEADRAKKLGKLTPLRIDDAELPLGFGVIQTTDLTGWRGDKDDPRLRAVAVAVGEKVGTAPEWLVAEPESGAIELRSTTSGDATEREEVVETARPMIASPQLEAEARQWADALESRSLGDIHAYLEGFGADGVFSDQARFELNRIRLRRNALTFSGIFLALFTGSFAFGPDVLLTSLGSFGELIWGGSWQGNQILPMGPITIALLVAMIYVSIRSRFLAIRSIPRAFMDLFGTDSARPTRVGSMSGKAAFWTAICAVVGTGNFFGVAMAMLLGGPGALIWMCVTSIFAISLIHADAFLAVSYQENNDQHGVFGGAMHYLANGLGWAGMPLAALFLIGVIGTAVTTGNAIQAKVIADTVVSSANLSSESAIIPAFGLALALIVLMFSGARGIGIACRVLGPIMLVSLAGLGLWACFTQPDKLSAVILSVTSGQSMAGDAAAGMVGGGIAAAFRFGATRGLFSAEAGQGTTGIIHGASTGTSAQREAGLAGLVLVFDSIIINVLVALLILIGATYVTENGQLAWLLESNEWNPSQLVEIGLSNTASGIEVILPFLTVLLAFSTILAWSFLAERAMAFIVGPWFAPFFRVFWAGLAFAGSLFVIDFLWAFGDLWNALMVVSALTGILVLTRNVRAKPRAS